MEFRTTFTVKPSKIKISFDTPVMFTGSCFANEIGEKMSEGRMKVMINPAGTVYNPVSISNVIRLAKDNRIFGNDDLYSYKGKFLSFQHYTDFTSEDPSVALRKINEVTLRAHHFLKSASFLVVTFGTARVYRLKKTGEIVSNCHKLPHDLFTNELLTVDAVVSIWKELIESLRRFNSEISLIFTVSPVRHMKDSAHGNQVSKSVLFLAIEELLGQPDTAYFPAYELLMDDLRDYRYYAGDMLHPSGIALDYIWDAFTASFFDKQTLTMWKEVSKITRAMRHEITDITASAVRKFASVMISRIFAIHKKYPAINLAEEESYFRSLQK